MLGMTSARRGSEHTRAAVLLAAAVLALSYILFAGGCDVGSGQVVREEDESHFVRGKEELKRGNYDEALNAFLKVTEKRRDAAESHLDIGLIYLKHLNDPIQAIYHFRKFLELKPDAKESQRVRQCIDTAQKTFAATLPGNPYDVNLQNLEMEEALRAVKAENLELKQQLANALNKISVLEATQSVTVASNRPAVPAPQPQAGQAVRPVSPQQPVQDRRAAQTPAVARDIPQSYVVQKGDTLSSISRKIYGSSARWKDIYNANRDSMSSPTALKPGQTLKLPR